MFKILVLIKCNYNQHLVYDYQKCMEKESLKILLIIQSLTIKKKTFSY